MRKLICTTLLGFVLSLTPFVRAADAGDAQSTQTPAKSFTGRHAKNTQKKKHHKKKKDKKSTTAASDAGASTSLPR